MALPTAQLGQLPAMNLAGYGTKNFVEPAWHKALAAFLVNAAGNAASTGIGNALSRDVTPQAVAQGVAPTGQTTPTFWDQVIHGPQWTQKTLDEALKTKQQGQAYAQTAAYEQGMLKNDQARTAAETAHQRAMEDAEAKRLGMTAEEYKAARNEREYEHLMQSQDRREAMLETARQHQAEGPEITARTQLLGAQAQHTNLENDPTWQGKVKAAQTIETMRALGIDPSSIGGRQAGTANPQNPTQPPDNSATVDFHSLVQPSPAYGPPANSQYQQLQNMKSTGVPYGPTSVQPSGPHDALRAREAQNRAQAGGTSSQMGQSAPMQAAPPPPSANNAPVSFSNPMEQAVGNQGFPSDSLSMSAVPFDPRGLQGGLPSSASAFIPPMNFDPDTLRRAAALARFLGQGQSLGGTPNAAGSGGTPIGYG